MQGTTLVERRAVRRGEVDGDFGLTNDSTLLITLAVGIGGKRVADRPYRDEYE